MFEPRTADEIVETIVAQQVTRTKINDTTQGSVLYGLAYPVAQEIANAELRFMQVRNAFDLLNPAISESDFDERCKELPGKGMERLGASAASGGVLAITRKDILAQQTLLAGATVGRNDGSPVIYRTTVDVVFAIGTATVTGIPISAIVVGVQGNAPIGVLSEGMNLPDWVQGVTNTLPLNNGYDKETLTSAQHRVGLYLSALSGTQKAAMEYLALSFTSSDGARVRAAKAFVDPTTPGLAELIVDDGTDMSSLKQDIVLAPFGSVPPGGQSLIVHPGPATQTLGSIAVARAAGGIDILEEAAGQIVSVYESGYVYVPDDKPWKLLQSDSWSLPLFSIWTGFISELQRYINGDVNDPYNAPGWAALGCRVAVKAPTIVPLELAAHVVSAQGADLDNVKTQVLNVVLSFVGNLGPGEPLYVSQLIAACLTSQDILNIRFYVPSISPPQPLADQYVSPKKVLRIKDENSILFIPGVA